MKAGRNDPCPCGSGAKYKRCCLLKEDAARQESAAEAAEQAERKDERVAALDALTGFRVSNSLVPLRPVARLFGLLEPLPEGLSQPEVTLKFYFFVHFDVRLDDGRTVTAALGDPGYLEQHGRDITEHGGFAAYLRTTGAQGG